MTLDPHVAILATITLGVGWMMAQAGLAKSALELKKRRRVCPSCGRRIDSRICSTCA